MLARFHSIKQNFEIHLSSVHAALIPVKMSEKGNICSLGLKMKTKQKIQMIWGNALTMKKSSPLSVYICHFRLCHVKKTFYEETRMKTIFQTSSKNLQQTRFKIFMNITDRGAIAFDYKQPRCKNTLGQINLLMMKY